MPEPVLCPTCREELEIPPEFRGRAVRCGACQTTFTPPAPTVAARRMSPDPTDDPRQSDTPLPEPRARRVVRRRSLTGLWIVLVGTVGFCCVGCGALAWLGQNLAQPELQTYTSPDNRFQAGFPCEPAQVRVRTIPSLDAARFEPTTVYKHDRLALGQPHDTYFVQVRPLKSNRAGGGAQAVTEQVINELLAEQLGSNLKLRRPALTNGAPGEEVHIMHNAQNGTVARVFVAEETLYIVGVSGRLFDLPEQPHIIEFFNTFRLLNAAPGDVE